MRNAVTRWSIYLAALLVLGPLAGQLTAALRTDTGALDATPLVSSSPLLGLGAALGALLLALAVGLAGARLVNVHSGMTGAGLVAAWAAWRTGRVDAIVRDAAGEATLWWLAAEGLVIGILGVALAAALVLVARRGDAEEPTLHTSRSGAPRVPADARERLRAALPGPGAAAPFAAALIAGGVAAWLLAREPHKFQCIMAAAGAGLAAAVVGRLVDYRAPILTFFGALAILAVAGPAIGVALAPRAGVLAAINTRQLFPLAYPVPLDWIAGALLGVPLGAAWAASMIDKRAESSS